MYYIIVRDDSLEQELQGSKLFSFNEACEEVERLGLHYIKMPEIRFFVVAVDSGRIEYEA